MQWMIYGASGYTGALIARQALQLGLRPILAGRSQAVQALAAELGLDARLFDLQDAAACRAGLTDVGLVLNCAGPFSATIGPMLQACLQAGAHYLDITGEIEVFEQAFRHDAEARERGLVVCPGVGFDVVPTDCVAAALKAALPDARSLSLGFDMDSSLSPGTAKSALEGLPLGGKVREGGRIVTVPLAWRRRRIDFGLGPKQATTIPWGDVSTAYHSTGIAQISCYIPMPPALSWALRLFNPARRLLALAGVQRLGRRLIDRYVHGPDLAQRTSQSTAVWGEARNARGEVRIARLRTSNPYELTVHSALAVVRQLLAQAPAQGGYYTPSRLCGWQLVERLPGCGQVQISHA